MNVLLLGGARFLGRYIVRSLIDNNHHVTVFNRGKTNPEFFKTYAKNAKFTHIIGDRNKDLNKLIHQKYDAIIDTFGEDPINQNLICKNLRKITKYFIYVSSCSVYRSNRESLLKEDSNTVLLDSQKSFGERKLACEHAVKLHFPDQYLIIRPSAIVGQNESTLRLPYWLIKFSTQNDIIVPTLNNHPVQIVDAQDIARWLVKSIDRPISGIFNISYPPYTLTFRTLIKLIRKITHSQSNIHWLDTNYLLDQKITPWKEIPFWCGKYQYVLNHLDTSKINGTGFFPTQIIDTVQRTYHWVHSEAKNLIKEINIKMLSQFSETRLLRKWLTHDRN